jgi:hypothetical protein
MGSSLCRLCGGALALTLQGFDAGDVFFFDVEFTTATERSTVLGNFTLIEDRTLN